MVQCSSVKAETKSLILRLLLKHHAIFMVIDRFPLSCLQKSIIEHDGIPDSVSR